MRRGSRASLCLAAVNHDRASPHVFLLIDAQLLNAGTVKSGRNEGINELSDNFLVLLRLRGERAKAK